MGDGGLPLPCINHLDDEAQPSGFDWSEECTAPSEEAVDGALGCTCAGGTCSATGCACRQAGELGADAFLPDGRLMPLVHGIDWDEAGLRECGPACSCGGACALSVTGRPPRRGLCLEKLPGKRWGVVAGERIGAGEYICCYAGEYVSREEAQWRLAAYDAAGRGHALLVLRQWLPSHGAVVRVNIDATRRGNVARFCNHSCDGGNLRLVEVVRSGALLPRLALFASAGIAPGQELTYAYGAPNAERGRPCLCGTASCKGFLPHDEV